mmetsp:Transcript_16518/g.34714  ORF Transcript_16518/g.34714 Transcript_16518/m.34714 type:complete len:214 (-) Transcript_16518:800-1441(-)
MLLGLIVIMILDVILCFFIQPFEFVKILKFMNCLRHLLLFAPSKAIVSIIPCLPSIRNPLLSPSPLRSGPPVYPVHKMIVGTVFRSPHRIFLSHQQFFHVSRMIPSLGSPRHGRIIPDNKRQFLLPIIIRLVKFRPIIKYAKSLVNLVVGGGIVRTPIVQHFQHRPLHGISLWRMIGTIVNIVRGPRFGGLSVVSMALALGFDESEGSFVVFG